MNSASAGTAVEVGVFAGRAVFVGAGASVGATLTAVAAGWVAVAAVGVGALHAVTAIRTNKRVPICLYIKVLLLCGTTHD